MIRELSKTYRTGKSINSPSSIFEELKCFGNADREMFIVFHLNTKNKIIKREIISIGTLNASIIHPREVFKGAIINSANCIILAHNHPSGDLEPSPEDIIITKELIKAGKILDIKVLDHIIFNDENYSSLANELGEFKK